MLSETSAVGDGAQPSGGPADRSQDAARASFLLCRTGPNFCALPLDHVSEIMRALPIEAVTGAPRYLRGLCVIRGAPAPIVDTGLLLGGRPSRAERLVAIKVAGRIVALAVDAVLGVRAIAVEACSELPPLLRDASEAIAAIGTLDSAFMFVLRTARIVPEDLFIHLRADGAAS